jgi:hypothetical protein
MPLFASFLHEVLFEGRIHLPALPAEDDPEAVPVLREAHQTGVLALAGPPLAFDEATALAAGRLLMHAAWYFLHPDLPIEAHEQTLRMPAAPTRAEQHFAADLVLRYLPTLYYRAQALLKDDVLHHELQRTLRQWPLSGVLADISEPPLTPPDFGPHAGLNFLYAERLAEHERPAWFPTGRGLEYVELVWQQLGKDTSVLPLLV